MPENTHLTKNPTETADEPGDDLVKPAGRKADVQKPGGREAAEEAKEADSSTEATRGCR